MLRSLFSAVAGLRSHQTMMDVIGNNIANVNTTGYKTSQTVFEDTLSQVVRNSGTPQGAAGGSNPAQVGLGVRVGGIATNFGQGASQVTGRATDVALQGDGFFVVKADGQTLYSRAGAFSFDAAGNLTNPDGAVVQGWPAVGGSINTNAPVGPLKLPVGQTVAPQQTRTVNVGGNLSSDAAVGTTWASPVGIYDSQGAALEATLTYTKTDADTWGVSASVPDAGGTPVTVGSSTLRWNPATKAFTPPTALTLGQGQLGTAGYSFASAVQVSLGTAAHPLTQFASPGSAAATDQDGAAMGTLQSFTLNPEGALVGLFSNGVRQDLGQVAVANFGNPPGLEKAGGSLYRSTSNSGVAAVGVAGTGGRGTLASGTLEMSNVDLAQEFTNLIVAQRGFQANSKVVSASDEILQDLINMKR